MINKTKKVKYLNNAPPIIGEWLISYVEYDCVCNCGYDPEHPLGVATIEFINNKYIITSELEGYILKSTELTLTKENDAWFLNYTLENGGGFARLMWVYGDRFYGSFCNLNNHSAAFVTLIRQRGRHFFTKEKE